VADIVVEGIPEFDKMLATFVVDSDLAARNIVTKGALIIERNAKLEFRGRPAGSQRTSKKTGRVYYAGAPKFPAAPPQPTNRTGNLQASIRMQKVTGLGAGRWQSDTGPSVKYGPYVNFGTSRARAFPFMTNGFKNSLKEIQELAETEWAAAQS